MQPDFHNPSRTRLSAGYSGADARTFAGTAFGDPGKGLFLDDQPEALRLLTDLLLIEGYSAFASRDDHVRNRLANLEANLRGNVASLRRIQDELRSMADTDV